jgi:hypothetical protein
LFNLFNALHDWNHVSYQSSTGFADPREMKLCPIWAPGYRGALWAGPGRGRTSLFLSDGWESVELYEDASFY